MVTGHYVPKSYEEYKGSVESVRLEIEGSPVRDSAEAQCCVLEQDTLSSLLILVQPRKTGNRYMKC